MGVNHQDTKNTKKFGESWCPWCLGGLLLAAVTATAHAGKKEPPQGSVAYVADGAVWRAPLASPEQASKVADLPVAPALVVHVSAAADGSALLVDLGANAAWIDLAGAAPPVYLPCRGGRISSNGHRVLCAARGGAAVVYRLRPRLGSAPLVDVDPARSAHAGDHLVVEKGGTLVAQGGAVVAPQAPADLLSVAPNGERAVGRYRVTDDEDDALHGFRLDGRAARRKLIPGTPIAWSSDSTWLAIESGDEACAVRAAGGEYKCWKDYQALAIGPGGALALLAQPADDGALALFLVPTDGVRPQKPTPLLPSARAATLLP